MDKKTDNDSEKNDFSNVRILVVDNERPLAQVMTESLERIDLNVDMATSGPEGTERVDEKFYDVVVSDLVMNDVDGMGVLKKVREVSPETEVILVTGHASVPKAGEAMQEGAFNFLEKPDHSQAVTSGRFKSDRKLAVTTNEY